jgi:hypothetical protein
MTDDVIEQTFEDQVALAVEHALRQLPQAKLIDRDEIVDVLLDLRRKFTTS